MTELLPGQTLNVHVGKCGACGGDVTVSYPGTALPKCEQCGAEPVHGPTLPMKEKNDAVQIKEPSPSVLRQEGPELELSGMGVGNEQIETPGASETEEQEES